MKKYIFLIGFIIISVLVIISYNDSNSYSNKVINYNGNNLMVSVDGVNSNNIPSSGKYYLTSYKCGSKSTKIKWDMNSYSLSISNGSKDAGVYCNLNFSSKPKLLYMESGSYVKFVGNNGCIGSACDGVNVGYINDDDMGYCGSKDNKYITSGWRIFYVDDDSVYLVNGGALECVKKGNSDNSILFLNELNVRALSYCNKKYAYNGECNNYSAHVINEVDFSNYLDMNIRDCMHNGSNMFCGYNDDLIDNGGYYWFGVSYDSASNKLFNWSPYNRYVDNSSYVKEYGLRVVLKLSNLVYVVDGDGSYNNPYVISI